MTGEDVAKTGGSFLVERWPDPAAVWERPWDPHSDWGSGRVRPESLQGDLINDVHLSICYRVASRSDWAVSTNPYEGGSDPYRVRGGWHSLAARLAFHRSLLPHEHGHARQDERRRDAECRRCGGGLGLVAGVRRRV